MSNPWRGLAAYNEPQDGEVFVKFCGRDAAIRTLTSLIQQNLFVTLYGKTGVGKTSLLRAGIFPRLRRDGFAPVLIRLNNVPEGKSYIAYILEQMIAELKKYDIACLRFKNKSTKKEKSEKNKKSSNPKEPKEEIDSPLKLRLFFATHVFNDKDGNIIYPVIVLDQFEEAIYHDFDKTMSLLDTIHALVDGTSYFPAIKDDFHQETNYRFVVSIREDDLFLMEDIIDEHGLGRFKNNRFRLRSLSKEEAKEVVVNPGENFIPNDEKDGVAERLIALSSERGHVNTLSLSLFCSILYNRSNGGNITAKMADELSPDSLSSFYLTAISALPKKERAYLESKLIDANGRRDSISILQMKEHAPHAEYLFEDETRILQQVNGRVELVHDLLAHSIFNMTHEVRRSIWRKVTTLCMVLGLIAMLLISFRCAFNIYKPNLYDPFMEYVSPKSIVVPEDYSAVDGQNNTEHIITQNEHVKIINCPALKSVSYPDKASSSIRISNCPQLVDINLPSHLTAIWIDINDCPNVGPIKIGSEVDKIRVTSSDTKLSFEISPFNNNYKWENGILYNLRNGHIEYVIPEIAEWKYAHIDSEMIKYDNIEIKNITSLPFEDLLIINGQTLKGIKDPYYSGVLDLSNLKDVKVISENAFNGIKGITSVVLPDSLQTIHNYAFAGLNSITSISFPPSLSYIGEFAFAGCDNLEEVTFTSTSSVPSSTSFVWCDKAEYRLVSNSEEQHKSIEIRNNILYYDGWPLIFGKDALISKEDLDLIKRYSYIRLEHLGEFSLYYPPSVKFTEDNKENRRCWNILRDLPAYCKGEKATLKSAISLLAVRDTVCKELQINYTDPHIVKLNSFAVEEIPQYIPEAVKRGITIIVPWGCVSNFTSNPQFQGFKEIREGSFWERLKGLILYQIYISTKYIHTFSWAKMLAYSGIFLVAIFFFSLSWISFSKDDKRRNTNLLRKLTYCVLVTIGMLGLCMLAFISGYAFVEFVLRIHSLSWKIIIGAILVVGCYVFVYGNLLFNVFSNGFISGLKEIGNTLLSGLLKSFQNLTNRKKIDHIR